MFLSNIHTKLQTPSKTKSNVMNIKSNYALPTKHHSITDVIKGIHLISAESSKST